MMELPWEGRMEPFCLCGNVYFCGTHPASTHLIDTGDGLLILDSGYQESLYLMLESIHTLGFSPKDIRWILHSHGHVDHAGATRALVEMTGAKTYIGEGDCDIVNGTRPLTWGPEYNLRFNAFEPDVLIHDGDVLTFGNTVISCMATPGHTPGTFSYFWNIALKDGRTLRAGTMGGAGVNTIGSSYVRQYHLEAEDWRGAMGRSFARCRGIPVDVYIGNHVWMNDTHERYDRLKAGDTDAFVDPTAWDRSIAQCQAAYDDVLAKDPL